jgi:integrase
MKKRKDGTYRRTIVDKRTGKRIYFQATTEREVLRKIMDYESKAEHGRTFEEVADEWWDEAYDKISPNTAKGYKAALKRLLAEFGDWYVKDIKARDISKWLRSLALQGFAYKTVKNHKIVISRILHIAVIDGDIDYNPAEQAEVPRGMPKEKRPPASVEDEAKIRESIDIWLFPFAALMTGMRKGELLALQWKDIDFEHDEISVTKSVYYEGDTPKIKAPKSDAGVRRVILLQDLKEELLKRKGRPDEYIFSEDGGKTPYKEMRYDRLMKKYQEQTGITATAHQLRKSFASIAAAANIDTKVLQRLLGHTDIRLTLQVYADVREDAWEEARKILNEKI